MEKELTLDNLDQIVFSLFKNKELKEDTDYIISIHEKDKETTTVLIEQPFYSDKGWEIIKKSITIKNNTILKTNEIIKEEKYSLADLTDNEYQKRRVYNFIQSDKTLYVERKKTIIQEKRKIETTSITFDLKNKVVNRLYKSEKLLSESLPIVEYKEAFSRPSISLGYGNNFDYYDDDTFTL